MNKLGLHEGTWSYVGACFVCGGPRLYPAFLGPPYCDVCAERRRTCSDEEWDAYRALKTLERA